MLLDPVHCHRIVVIVEVDVRQSIRYKRGRASAEFMGRMYFAARGSYVRLTNKFEFRGTIERSSTNYRLHCLKYGMLIAVFLCLIFHHSMHDGCDGMV